MEETTETLTYYKDAADSDTLVAFAIQYQVLDENDDPITGDVTEAEFRIISGTSRKVRKTLSGTDLTWDDATASLTGSIYNSDVTFIKDDGDYEYCVFIVLDGTPYTLAQGPLEATRVD